MTVLASPSSAAGASLVWLVDFGGADVESAEFGQPAHTLRLAAAGCMVENR